MEGSQNFKSMSRDSFPYLFDLILFFLVMPLVFKLHAKFDVSSSDRSGYVKGVPKFEK